MDLFASALRRPVSPSSPSWSVLPTTTDAVTSGLDGIFFVESFGGTSISGRSLAFLQKSTGAVITGEDADGVAVGSWSQPRPLTAVDRIVAGGRVVEVDGTSLDSASVGLRQPSVGPVGVGGAFRVVAITATDDVAVYSCQAGSDGTVSVGSSSVVTSGGGYSWPSISPDGNSWVAQKGPLDSPQIVLGTFGTPGTRLLALGRTPSWK